MDQIAPTLKEHKKEPPKEINSNISWEIDIFQEPATTLYQFKTIITTAFGQCRKTELLPT